MDPRKYHFKYSTVTVIFGDIMNSKAQVIVSSDDTNISMKGGVSKCILEAGGPFIKEDAKKKLPAKIGDVVVSTAGNLENQKYVFHCMTIGDFPTITFADEKAVRKHIIKESIDKCFRLLNALDIESIAFPCIGTGTAGIPMNEAAVSMAEAISRNLFHALGTYNVELYLMDHKGKRRDTDYIDIFENFAAKSAECKMKQEMEQKALSRKIPKGEISSEQLDDIVIEKEDMEHEVFISYSRQDSETVLEIHEALEANGIHCWIDRIGISGGEHFQKAISNAIKTAKVVLFISSESSNVSSYVQKEIYFAVQHNKAIIPIKLDDAPYDPIIGFEIGPAQHIEYTSMDQVVKELLVSLACHLQVR